MSQLLNESLNKLVIRVRVMDGIEVRPRIRVEFRVIQGLRLGGCVKDWMHLFQYYIYTYRDSHKQKNLR